jgi:hypothetical protein
MYKPTQLVFFSLNGLVGAKKPPFNLWAPFMFTLKGIVPFLKKWIPMISLEEIKFVPLLWLLILESQWLPMPCISKMGNWFVF